MSCCETFLAGWSAFSCLNTAAGSPERLSDCMEADGGLRRLEREEISVANPSGGRVSHSNYGEDTATDVSPVTL